MRATEPLFGETLEAWLCRLETDRFQVGLRERMRVHQLLDAACADGLESLALADRLRWLAPVLCRTADEQRRYGELLEEFLAVKPARRIEPTFPTGPKPEDNAWQRWLSTYGGLAILVVIALGIAAIGLRPWLKRKAATETETQGTNKPLQESTAPRGVPTKLPSAPKGLRIVESVELFQFSRVSRLAEVRSVSWTLAAVGALGLLAFAWGLGRRRIFLQSARTEREVEERVLTDPNPQPSIFPAGPVRAAVRGLRQRTLGHREVLDSHGTIRNAIRTGGAFVPRYRRVRTTPEYLALIDRRHRMDHFAEFAAALVRAVSEQGLNVQVRYFDGSPEHGCREGQDGGCTSEARLSRAWESWGAVRARHEGQRLLIFSETGSLLDPVRGGPRDWVQTLEAFPERAWFTPLPIADWGSGEDAADDAGFLILPAQPESMSALAVWLSAETPTLGVSPDWPTRYPTALREEALSWVVRGSPPTPDDVEQLLRELRAYLGPRGFQWLCACAIFPAVSPPLTLALGRDLGRSARELALGLAALGGLPWFRHGFMPAWLRQRLVERLSEENETRCRRVIEERLGAAVLGAKGMELARVAWERRLWAWLARKKGPARDAVLVTFLRKDAFTRLAQQLPANLKKRLFHEGLPAYGLKAGWIALMAALVLLVGAFPWAWSAWGWRETAGEANSLGMRFVPVPGTDVLFSIWETRVQDYAAYAGANQSTEVDNAWRDPMYKGVPVTPGPTHPVVYVSWEDANRFCDWLTRKERDEGLLSPGQRYRLPTDREWSAAVGLAVESGATPKDRNLEVRDVYPWGTQWPPPENAGNFADETARETFKNDLLFAADTIIRGYRDRYATTAPVGTFTEGRYGLFDLSGNVWEWCSDTYTADEDSRIVRGGSWVNVIPEMLLSSFRAHVRPGGRDDFIGFRVVLSGAGSVR